MSAIQALDQSRHRTGAARAGAGDAASANDPVALERPALHAAHFKAARRCGPMQASSRSSDAPSTSSDHRVGEADRLGRDDLEIGKLPEYV